MANRKRKCCHCKDYFPAESGVVINSSFFCSMDHVITHGREKGNKAIERQEYSQIYDVLNRHISGKFGLFVGWPSKDTLRDRTR